ncbi:MAG: rhodanese-like domain-containing protein [Melioribacteraceae bacterium]|nr:rhodanese-like domain-containing protein [Melioribacteraceae bacterium]
MGSIFSTIFGTGLRVINLDSENFERQMKSDKNAVLMDVRTDIENAQVRIPNSILIDISSPEFMDRIMELDKSKSYYIYCRSGNRSYHAARQMMQLGFESVYNLEPGIIGWHGEIESDYKS